MDRSPNNDRRGRDPGAPISTVFRLVWPLLRPHGVLFAISIVAGFGTGVATLALPWFGKQAVSVAAGNPAEIPLARLLVYFLAFLVVLAICLFSNALISSRIANRVVADLRYRLFTGS